MNLFFEIEDSLRVPLQPFLAKTPQLKNFQGTLVPKPTEDFFNFWQTTLKDRKPVLLPFSLSEAYFSQATHQSLTAREVGSVDVLFFEDAQWLSSCLLREALVDLIPNEIKDLSVLSKGFISGINELAAVSVSAMSYLGFRKIGLIVEEKKSAQNFLNQVRKKYFGIEFILYDEADLTLLPNQGSFLINHLPLSEMLSMEETLSYLNFLGAESLVMNTELFPLDQILIEEAKGVNLKSITAGRYWGYRDYLFLKKMDPHFEMPFSKYLGLWESHLESVQPQPE